MSTNETVVCITGASRGIGRAIAHAFFNKEARLILISRSAKIDVPSQNWGDSFRVLSLECDVSDFDQVNSSIMKGIQKWGKIDVLINAAAILGATGNIWETDPIEWAKAIKANLIGTYNTIRSTLPSMIAANRGKIINFAGGGAAYGYPLFSGYGASKAAVVRLTETMAIEIKNYNIQVNVVSPGAIKTDMLEEVLKAGGEVRTMGEMREVIDLVTFLSSSESDHINGRYIHVKDAYKKFGRELGNDLFKLRRIEK